MTLLDRIARRLRPPAALTPDADFDAAFYRARYPDLAALPSDAALFEHYARHGRGEGRFANAEAEAAVLQEQFGALPEGFHPADYRALNPDLRATVATDAEATEHFLRYGRKEGRNYIDFAPALYRSLYFASAEIDDNALERDYRTRGLKAGRIGGWRRFLEAEGWTGGAGWARALKLDEVLLARPDWAERVRDKPDVVRLMASEGVAGLTPIAFDAEFDPGFYRSAYPETAALSDAELYRSWLAQGFEMGRAPSARLRLRDLGLPLQTYPTAFDWRLYAKGRGLSAPNCWSALEDLVLTSRRLDLVVASGPEAGLFYAALGEAWRGPDQGAAVRAYETARSLGVRTYAVAQHLADAYLNWKRWADAARLYAESTAFPDAEVWAFTNGATAAARAGMFKLALDLLARSRSHHGGAPAWRDAMAKALDALFEARSRRIRALYALGDRGRARADVLLERLIARVGELWREAGLIGAPMPPAVTPRVVILANADLPACWHYRVEQKRELFDALGIPVEIYTLDEIEDGISALVGAAAVIVFRLAAWPAVVRAVLTARTLGVPTYYDIDDLLFDAKEFPDSFESYAGLISRETYEGLLYGVPMTRAAMALCDYGIASTEPLARAMRPVVRTGEVFVLPNGLDSRNMRFLKRTPPRVRRDGALLVACTSGTAAHSADFLELAGPGLLRLLETRPEARILLIGQVVLGEAFAPYSARIDRFEYVDGLPAFWSLLAEADLNLAVLKPTWTTDAKSEIKWLEAAALAIPSVVSDTAVYKAVIDDGVDGLIAATPDDWSAALLRLADDAELRQRIGAAARDKAARLYSVEANAERLKALLAPALDRVSAPRTRPEKPRVLLVNVFFPPQTIGGATRVVRNNLDCWLDAGVGEAIDFAVVASDVGVEHPYAERVDAYRGVPVLRISTPAEVNMDWRPLNREVGDIFAEHLAAWRPDLVHFHAVQRLTASVVRATQAAGIPYLVTAHDAWWISDWPFLVDDDGRVHPPCEDLPRHRPQGVGVAKSLERRRVLRAALDGAERVLGVSQVFADLYRGCGFDRAIAVPNGVPPMTEADRTRSPSGRVRLAHVGNTTKHKGFHLVEAALRQGRYRNLELTAIDHGRPAGSALETVWGETPVRIVGKLAQEEVHRLYAETDVLLAPSIWPESFGLVAREALACGCWVVASDRGAMGEDVTPGVNGFVIDVSDLRGVVGTLAEIDADPQRYLQPPAVRPTLRPADDQARELMALYREILAGRELRTPAFPPLKRRRRPRSHSDRVALETRVNGRESDEG